jgi:hypothetical protein
MTEQFNQFYESFFRREKGASGSWAEPCFACPALRCGGFAYPPGILEAVFNSRIKEKRILGRILYNGITI